MKTPRILVQSCVAVLLAAPFGCSESTDPAGPLKEIKVGARPESVVRGFGGRLYVTVGNLSGGQEGGGPADGEVQMVDGDKVTTFASGMYEPRGMAFTGDFLVVADETQVWKIDSTGTKSLLAAVTAFPAKPGLLNDTAVEVGNQAVFVSDMGQADKIFNQMTMPISLWAPNSTQAAQIAAAARVYRISVPGGQVTVAVDSSPLMRVVNGVTAPTAPPAGRMLLAEFFDGNILERTGTGPLVMLATGYRGADGIEQDEQGNIYVSSYTQGKVWKLDRTGKNEKVILDNRGFGSTADHFLDLQNRILVVPDTAKATLIYLPI